MGFDEGRMTLDSPNGTYYSGQTVHGKLIFQQDRVKTFRGLYVKIKGFCKVHWTTHESRTVNGRRETYTVSHDSHEEYINLKIYLVGGESGEYRLQPGDYEYPFSFRLPVDCPSSFEGEYGHIRYEIKAVVDRAFKIDQEKKVAVRVMAPLDLNLDPYCREPIDIEFDDSYCCCCMTSGSTNTLIKLPVSGYCPGQNIPIEISCSNKSNVEISNIKLSITKTVVFIATMSPGRKKVKDTVVQIKKGPVAGNTSRNWIVDMEVPAMDVYNLFGCRFIQLEYNFVVTMDPDGCHSDSEAIRRLVIGIVPLVGYQDDIQNPLHDQIPQHIAAVTQQPLPTYPPAITPYSDGETPYPARNPPYPGEISNASPYPAPQPYPAANSPYPAANRPYPDKIAPYPTSDISKSPYPSTNSPYSASGTASAMDNSSSPYSATNEHYSVGNTSYLNNPPPYPGVNPPYPAAISPTPAVNPPYPIMNSPNLTTNPPYPITNSPYPPPNMSYQHTPNNTTPIPTMGGSLLRTGNLGFIVQGSGGRVNIPTLPPGATLPNPVTPANPYSIASAPTLDSPAADEKKQ